MTTRNKNIIKTCISWVQESMSGNSVTPNINGASFLRDRDNRHFKVVFHTAIDLGEVSVKEITTDICPEKDNVHNVFDLKQVLDLNL